MGRTIPSYRIASEMEIRKWRPFRKLLDKQDRKKFDDMLSIPRFYNVAGTMGLQTCSNSCVSNVNCIRTLQAIEEEISSKDEIECIFSLFNFVIYNNSRF